jgi:hypothetical protein
MKFASVKQAVKFGIAYWGWFVSRQANLCKDCKMSKMSNYLIPPWYEQQYQIDTHFNYYVNTYKSTLTVEPIFHFIHFLNWTMYYNVKYR